MRLQFEEYEAEGVVNVHRHVDHWFWDRYSAHPYVGCATGCEFCYLRGGRYLGRNEPDDFDRRIRVKTNAAGLLARELAGLEPDIIACGDWQLPAEKRYRLSRAMLEVVCEAGFPLFVVERSPYILNDIELLREISEASWAGVAFSISSLDPGLKKAFEPRSAGVKQRLAAMERLAEAGIETGTALMPVIPSAGDSEEQLEAVISATAEHGGGFVLAGGLSMDGLQAERMIAAAACIDESHAEALRELYRLDDGGKPDSEQVQAHNARIGRLVRDLCGRYGLKDRMPRYVPPGPLEVNRRIAEKLFLKTYELELEGAAGHRVWAFRKAAWTVDEWPGSIAHIFGSGGVKGLMELPGIGQRLAGEIGRWLIEIFRERKEAGGGGAGG